MQFWSGTAFMKTSEIVAVARMLDEAGFDGMLCSDHMIYPRELSSPYPDSPSGKPPWAPETAWPDCWVQIGAMAAVTERLRFSNAVYVAPGASAAGGGQAGRDRLGDLGRAGVAGGGVGWMREEYELMGQDFRTRGKRLDEMIPALRALWRGGWVSWSGEHYQVPEMMIEPHPPRRCRSCAAASPMRRCGARRDCAMAGSGTRTAGTTRSPTCDKLTKLRREYGRDSEPFDIMLALLEPPSPDLYKRAEDAGITAVMCGPWVGGRIWRRRRCRALPGTDRAVRREHHRKGAVMSNGGDEVRGLVECLYSAIDRQDWSTVEAVVSPRLVVEVGSSVRSDGTSGSGEPEEFTHGISRRSPRHRGGPRRRFARRVPMPVRRHPHRRVPRASRRPAPRCRSSGIHIDRFQGDMLVAHRGQLDMHGLFQQLGGG